MAEDDDIRRAFERLKDEDAKITGEFEPPAAGSQSRWRGRHGVIGSTATAAAAAVILFFNLPSHEPETPGAEIAAAPQFEDYSDLVSRELFAAAPTWHSPTEFLLDYDITLTEIEP